MKILNKGPKENQKPRRITPMPKLSTLADVTPPENFIIAICDSAPPTAISKNEQVLAMAKKQSEKGRRIIVCGNLFLKHVENLTMREPERPDMQIHLLEAILEYPASKLANGLKTHSMHAIALVSIATNSPYESVREAAQEKIKKAKAFSGTII